MLFWVCRGRKVEPSDLRRSPEVACREKRIATLVAEADIFSVVVCPIFCNGEVIIVAVAGVQSGYNPRFEVSSRG